MAAKRKSPRTPQDEFDQGLAVGGPGYKSPQRREFEKMADDFLSGKRKRFF